MKSNKIIDFASRVGVTKAGIANEVTKLEFQIADGNLSGGKCLVLAKLLEEIAKGIRASAVITADAESEIDNGRTEQFGASLKLSNKTTYDYSDSPMWAELDAQEKAIKAQKKAIEAQAKVAKGAIVDPESGEVIAMPAKVSGGSKSISVSLKKA